MCVGVVPMPSDFLFFFCSPNDGVIINYSMPVMAIVTFAFAIEKVRRNV